MPLFCQDRIGEQKAIAIIQKLDILQPLKCTHACKKYFSEGTQENNIRTPPDQVNYGQNQISEKPESLPETKL